MLYYIRWRRLHEKLMKNNTYKFREINLSSKRMYNNKCYVIIYNLHAPLGTLIWCIERNVKWFAIVYSYDDAI